VDSLQSHGGWWWRWLLELGRVRGRDGKGRRSAGEDGEFGSKGLAGLAEGLGPLSFWSCRSCHRITWWQPFYAQWPELPNLSDSYTQKKFEKHFNHFRMFGDSTKASLRKSQS
jgi:hypothetical protein